MDEKVDVFMPLYVSDYLRDTSDLSLEENGAYCRLLFHLWVRRGSVPLDHDRLARVVGADRRTWARIWPVLERFFVIEGGQITQGRLAKELEKAKARKVQGRTAAEERWKRRKDATHDARALPEQCSDPCETDADTHPEGRADDMPNGWTSPSPSESQSESKPSSPPSSAREARACDPRPPAPAPAPAPDPRRGYAWLDAFKLAWRDRYQGAFYGNGSDAKPVRDLEDILREMPEEELGTLWRLRAAAFAAFLAADDERLTKARHPFAFFVARFTDYRPDLQARASPKPSLAKGWAQPSKTYGQGVQKL